MNRYSLYLLLFLFLSATPAQAQISVAPVALFMGDEQPFGTFYVSNQSGAAQEVTVEFRFGYPASDSVGNNYMVWEDSLAEAQHSIAPYLSAFPSRVMLPPGESQVIRLLARPPATLDDGVYWTRLITTSTPQQEFVDTTDTEGVSARVILRLQQVTSLLYEHGETNAEVSIDDIEVSQDTSGVVVSTWIERRGNAPFLGSAIVKVRDASGRVIASTEEGFAAYFDLVKRMQLPLSNPTPGQYLVEVTLTPERSDIPPPDRSDSQPVTGRVTFQIE